MEFMSDPSCKHTYHARVSSRIHCASCFYDLRAVSSGPCPECGRHFEVANPRTFTRMRKAPSLLAGLAIVLLLAVVASLGIGFAFFQSYVPDRHLAFWTIFGVGLAVGTVSSVHAASSRFLFVRLCAMCVGVLCFWVGLLFASDKFYRVWQASPNASDEAYSDSAPAGVLVLGWLPAIVFVTVVILLTFCARWLLRAFTRKTPPAPPVIDS
ncbi:MAG TPA: hypothetical protein DCX60_04085 [Phycisphaerales bacterium]|nr:hypothetical protein [Phycisphaerales bacterium]